MSYKDNYSFANNAKVLEVNKKENYFVIEFTNTQEKPWIALDSVPEQHQGKIKVNATFILYLIYDLSTESIVANYNFDNYCENGLPLSIDHEDKRHTTLNAKNSSLFDILNARGTGNDNDNTN